jgi:hypothetical protein
MNVSIFPPNFKSPKSNKLENITLRGFGGGWNAIETDLQMDSTFLVKVRNFRRTPGGTQKIRYGSKWFADLSDTEAGARIVNMIYFSANLICVLSNGHIIAIDGNGAKLAIWNPTIAALLPGAPAGWSANLDSTYDNGSFNKASVDFVAYKNQLIIHNGIDKPITISRTLVVTYLQDLASGSNVNVPIGRYGCVVSNYHCVAGLRPVPAANWTNNTIYAKGAYVLDPITKQLYICLVANTSTVAPQTFKQEQVAHPTFWGVSNRNAPTLIYISAVGTAGTFPGDPAPNDAITVDVGAFAPQGAVSIRGIAGFRANLLVFFQDQTVIVKLGTYNAAGIHEPFFPDTMPSFGLLGHRCYTPVENDLLFSGLSGMASARRNLLSVSGTLESQSLSERIEPRFKETIGNFTDEEQLKDCFQVYDPLSHDLWLFTPIGQIFVYSFNTKLKYSAWSEYSGVNVQCGCRTFLGRVFYADGLRVYQHGNAVFAGEKFFKDRTFDRDRTWANSTFYDAGDVVFDTVNGKVYECIAGHTSSNVPTTFEQDRNTIVFNPRWQEYPGEAIDFEMELPWLDSKNPMTVKFLRFVGMATKGDAKFFISAYVDNLYKNHAGDVVFDPSLSMEFIGNEGDGFGYDAGPYGGGRRSGDPRLWKFPCKFKTLKIRVHGGDAGDLEIVNMSFLFNRGKYRR